MHYIQYILQIMNFTYHKNGIFAEIDDVGRSTLKAFFFLLIIYYANNIHIEISVNLKIL